MEVSNNQPLKPCFIHFEFSAASDIRTGTSNGYDLAQKIIRVMEMDNSAQKKIGKTGRETIVKYNDIRNEMFRMKEIIDAEIFE